MQQKSVNRQQKSCTNFLNKILQQHLGKYKQMKDIVLDYARDKPTHNALEVFEHIVNIIGDDPVIVQDLNKLLHPDLKINEVVDEKTTI